MPLSLERFTDAQDGIWPKPLEEIRAGRKASRWMWFVWPQLRGLGRSATAEHYGIADKAEAQAYLAHDVLGTRLWEISRAMLKHIGTPPEDVLGHVDAMKLRSSATLFLAAGGGDVFVALLDGFYGDKPCPRTLELLAEEG